MPIRVALVGTGNCGRIALVQLIEDPRFELVAVGVSTEQKVGRDAGELAGLDTVTGITATLGMEQVLAAKPECLVYCAMGDTRPIEATRDVIEALAAGINVVGSAPVGLQYPWDGTMPDKAIAKVEAAAQQGNSSVFITGVDPGFVTDLVPFALAGTCQRIEQVRTMEIADYATYDGAEVMSVVMGFGNPVERPGLLFLPGVLTAAWGTGIRMLGAGLGVEIEEITEHFELEPAPEDIEVATGVIAKGTVAAMRFEIRGMVGGKPAVVVEHITRVRGDLRPDWAQPAQPGGSYRVQITGEPSYVVDICPTSSRGDHNYAAILVGAARIVNAIPAVVDAPAGVRTTLDLPLVTGRGVYRPA
jgi:hypothetical protein